MANDVFANGREISCKAADGKSICAFPDVCFTPPQTPATPPGVPIPYPNTAFAKDATKGSKKVKISNKEVMLKNKSHFKTSTGDEAGAAPKKGVITSKTKGKVYFTAWSMDVKFEGENVVRHLDLTTHNHASVPGNSPPWTYIDAVAMASDSPCKEDAEKAKESCKTSTPVKVGSRNHRDCSDECKKAMECVLVPKGKDKEMCCRPDNTGDHLIEDHWTKGQPDFEKPGLYSGAPCMCVNRSRYEGKHGIAHGTRGVREDALVGSSTPFTYAKAKEFSLESHADAQDNPKCKKGCIEAQLDHFYGEDPNKKCKQPTSRQPMTKDQRTDAQERISNRTATAVGGSAF
jgi:hypothetical protein